MVLSRTALQLIAANCRCPAPDTPDDMWLGACSESLGISIVHFSGFHQVVWRLLLSPIEMKDDQCYFCFFFFETKIQARPDDYPMELLHTQFVISFHKHWMHDPVQVYETWFADEDDFSISSPVDGDDGCSVMDPSQHCQVKQQPAELFQSTSIERLPDELWHISLLLFRAIGFRGSRNHFPFRTVHPFWFDLSFSTCWIAQTNPQRNREN